MSVAQIPPTSSHSQCLRCGKRGGLCEPMSLGLCVECRLHKSQANGPCVESRLRQGRLVTSDSLGWGEPDSACVCVQWWWCVCVCVGSVGGGVTAVTRYRISKHFSPSSVLSSFEHQPNIRFLHVDSLTSRPPLATISGLV